MAAHPAPHAPTTSSTLLLQRVSAMKLPSLAIKLSSSLKRLWTRRSATLRTRDESATRRSAAAPEVDSKALAQSILAALEIQSSPGMRNETWFWGLETHHISSISQYSDFQTNCSWKSSKTSPFSNGPIYIIATAIPGIPQFLMSTGNASVLFLP